MDGLTDYITKQSWEKTFTIWYSLIDDAYQRMVKEHGKLRKKGAEPTFSDSEVITVGLIIDVYFGGHEDLGLTFLRQYHLDMFPKLLTASQYNRRRRRLGWVIESIRVVLTEALLVEEDNVRLLDSAPIPVCTYARGPRCETVTGPEYASVMSSRKAKLFGFRLHASSTLDQVIDQWMIAPAAHKDGKMTISFFQDSADLWVLADNAYHDPFAKLWLANHRDVTLVTAERKDSVPTIPPKMAAFFNRLRRRIESVFAVLSTVFHFQTVGSRSLDGLITRLASRVLAYNLSFLTNRAFLALAN